MSQLPTALITGAGGQDGYYLARLLLERGYRVAAAVREPRSASAKALSEQLSGLEVVRFDLLSRESIEEALESVRPDEIYHLAAMSWVRETWDQPALAMETNTQGTLRLLESMNSIVPKSHLVFAGSSDCYDHQGAGPEGLTPHAPILCTSPYAVSKAAAQHLIECFRDQYALRASVAILFNHTSPRRPRRFVERQIVSGAVKVQRGEMEKLELGSMETHRDWSWAPDIVAGLAAMGRRSEPEDFVLASGELHTTGQWVRIVFERLDLEIEKHLLIKEGKAHGGERPHTFGDIGRTKDALHWAPTFSFERIVEEMIKAELALEPAPS